jgi:hypothetical protein
MGFNKYFTPRISAFYTDLMFHKNAFDNQKISQIKDTKFMIESISGIKFLRIMQVLLPKGFDDICNFGRPLIFSIYYITTIENTNQLNIQTKEN